jgi:hypothetical protein
MMLARPLRKIFRAAFLFAGLVVISRQVQDTELTVHKRK